jgi:hypothetical protein
MTDWYTPTADVIEPWVYLLTLPIYLLGLFSRGIPSRVIAS